MSGNPIPSYHYVLHLFSEVSLQSPLSFGLLGLLTIHPSQQRTDYYVIELQYLRIKTANLSMVLAWHCISLFSQRETKVYLRSARLYWGDGIEQGRGTRLFDSFLSFLRTPTLLFLVIL